MNLLPLDSFRAELGLHPWFFWGLANTTMPINAKCSGSHAGIFLARDQTRQGGMIFASAIARAEIKLRDYLGFWPAPRVTRRQMSAFWAGERLSS
jgi:hypothetical protein